MRQRENRLDFDPRFGGTAVRKTILVITALAATTFAVDALAQANVVNRPQVSSAAARKMVDACLAFAEKNNILVGVAVVGIDGTLLDFHAMQGGGPTMSETAILKAKTAVHWQRSTRLLEEDVTTQRNQASVWINDFPKAGALPIMIDGQVAGAIGIGGARMQEECAQAGIDAVFPKVPAASAQR
jgi:glc operon protein GlcG